MSLHPAAPKVSIVVVVHNMAREAPRTLYSLSAAHQRHIAGDDYEVIVVDNGSSPAFDAKVLETLSGRFRLIRIDPAPPSPAHAINRGLAEAKGEAIGVMIDGARLVTPGFVHFGRIGVSMFPVAVVASLGWHLGFDLQRCSIEAGYDAAREDALLASIAWPDDGYRLFEIAGPDGSSVDGTFQPVAESNGLFLHRDTWNALGGVDERFDLPGGGFLNLDTFARALDLPDSRLVVLLGEGTFHQLHGGIATNASLVDFQSRLSDWRRQYERIRGREWVPPAAREHALLGVLPPAALAHVARAAVEPAVPSASPLGRGFDRTLWSAAAPKPRDPAVAAVVALAQAEFRARRFVSAAAVARIARARAPDEIAPQRLLAQCGFRLRVDRPARNATVEFHLGRAKAWQLLGESEKAVTEYEAVLAHDDADIPEAYLGIVEQRMPGPNYLHWLQRFHEALRPETYLEIGVAKGYSLALARPPTRAIGIDPEPGIVHPFKTETHVFNLESDAVFADGKLAPLLEGRPLSLAFIDGLHEFAQALRDFINVEACCGPRSVVLFHDTVPFDERTQRPARERKFYTGDIWKTVLCLKRYRPDLDVFTVANSAKRTHGGDGARSCIARPARTVWRSRARARSCRLCRCGIGPRRVAGGGSQRLGRGRGPPGGVRDSTRLGARRSEHVRSSSQAGEARPAAAASRSTISVENTSSRGRPGSVPEASARAGANGGIR